MKELYNKYAEEWDNHDCRRGDPDDGCFCEMYIDFDQYANERFMQDSTCLNSDELCEDCGEDCGGDIVGCGDCGHSHCEYDPNCHVPMPWSQLSASQQDPPDPADPPTWQQVNADPADPGETTVPIDLKELDLEIEELDSFTMREPNELDRLKAGNAGKKVGESCWKCSGLLQQYGTSDPFCGKCECAIEKK